MLQAYIFDWLNLLLRWLHVITAIAWIGSSFYFVWLDNNLTPPQDAELKDKGVGGELWAVHGGGFYNPQKYLLAPKTLPPHLHWFFWEAYSTWLSGFALFTVLYLFNANTFLVDPGVLAMSGTTAVIAALAFLAGGWIVYDLICRVFGDRANGDRTVGVMLLAVVAIAAYLACHVFAGRAAFLLMGAMLGTIMSANVFFWIIPGQRKMVASMRAGETPDPIHGKRGKQRSVHNTYFTLPVLFAMLSNHYSMTYGAPHNWLVLLGIMLAGVLIRQFFVLRHKGLVKPVYPAVAIVLLVVVAYCIAPKAPEPDVAAAAPAATVASTAATTAASTAVTTDANTSGDTPTAAATAPAARGAPAGGAVSFATVQAIVDGHCIQCHSAKPTLMPVPGKGILLDSKAGILQHAQMIYQQAVVQKTMPLGNLTHLSDADRALLGKWFEAGAKGD